MLFRSFAFPVYLSVLGTVVNDARCLTMEDEKSAADILAIGETITMGLIVYLFHPPASLRD